MATTTTTTVTATGLVQPRRFTVEEYHRMAEAGILGEDDRIELIYGEIVEMSPIGDQHNSAVDRLNMRLVPALAGRAIVRVQGSVRLGGDLEPGPDLVVLRPRDDFYAVGGAGPEDVLLIMEVADTSLRYDREVKARIYAAAGIPEYWLWDVIGRAIIVHRGPGPDGYTEVAVRRGQDRLSPLAFPDVPVTVDEILPA